MLTNAARKEYKPLDLQEFAVPAPALAQQWFKVLGAVVLAALLVTAVAVTQVWMRLEIDQQYQRIDTYKIKNARLGSEIEKLQAQYNQLQSFEAIENNLSAAGVSMQTPEEVFYVDPSRATGNLALTSNYRTNDSI